MSGRIVYTPPEEHKCTLPNWGNLRTGSVAECDCGLTWVLGDDPVTGRHPWWVPEGRFARWFRERRQRRTDPPRGNGVYLLPAVHPGVDLEELPPSAAIVPPKENIVTPNDALATLEAALPANPDDHGPVAVPSDAIRILAKLRRRTAEPVAE